MHYSLLMLCLIIVIFHLGIQVIGLLEEDVIDCPFCLCGSEGNRFMCHINICILLDFATTLCYLLYGRNTSRLGLCCFAIWTQHMCCHYSSSLYLCSCFLVYNPMSTCFLRILFQNLSSVIVLERCILTCDENLIITTSTHKQGIHINVCRRMSYLFDIYG